jgi:hypothetical protein
MKKTIMRTRNVVGATLTTIAMALCTISSAQEQQTTTENSLAPKIGIKAGVNLSNLYIDNIEDENMKVGLNAGVFAKIPVAKGFSIQPELLYSSKGTKATYNNVLAGEGEYRFNLNYVEMPVLAVFNLGRNINIHAGPYVAFLAGANIKDIDSDGSENGVTDLKADNFNRFDFGLAGGIGFDFQNFMVGARYNYGLTEVGKSGSLSGELTKDSKNSAVSLYIGLGF